MAQGYCKASHSISGVIRLFRSGREKIN